MTTITIPKEVTKKGELAIVPREEYESLLELRRGKEVALTPAQKRALARAEGNFQKGKALSYHALAKKLGFTG